MVTTRDLYVVRHHRIERLLDVIEQVSAMDKVDSSQPDVVDLQLELAPDGMSATLNDPDPATWSSHAPPMRCADAPAALRKDLDEVRGDRVRMQVALPWIHFDRELVRRACVARGRYRWQSGTFVRTKRPITGHDAAAYVTQPAETDY